MPQGNDLSRRRFMMSAGAGLLAATSTGLLGGIELAPPDKQPPGLKVPNGAVKKLGFAIVGLGQLALEEVMPAFVQSLYARPVALVSGHVDKARKVADFYGIAPKSVYGYEDYDKLRDNPAVDVIYVILPNHMHAEYTIRGLTAGKHVLCEKPMCVTVSEARDMVGAAKKASCKLMIAYRLRYEPFNNKAIAMLRSGELGKIRSIEAQNLQDVKPPNIRLSTKTGGGPLGDVGIYCLNACRYLTGEEPVAMGGAMIQKPSDDERFAEVPESIAWTMAFPSGVLAACTCGFGSRESRQYRVVCSKGWLELENAFGYRGQKMRVAREKQVTELEIRPVNHFAAEMDHFAQSIMDDKPVLTPGEEGLRDMIHMSWIDEAARQEKQVKVTDDPPHAGEARAVAK